MKRPVNIVLDDEVIREVDAIRGDTSRSSWVNERLREALETLDG